MTCAQGPTLRKVPPLILCSVVTILKFLLISEQSALHFYFSFFIEPHNCVSGPGDWSSSGHIKRQFTPMRLNSRTLLDFLRRWSSSCWRANAKPGALGGQSVGRICLKRKPEESRAERKSVMVISLKSPDLINSPFVFLPKSVWTECSCNPKSSD